MIHITGKTPLGFTQEEIDKMDWKPIRMIRDIDPFPDADRSCRNCEHPDAFECGCGDD